MNCATHPEMPAIAYCRSCGKPLCDQCQRFAQGTVFCSEHAPAAASTTQTAGESYSPYTAPPTAPPPPLPDGGASPGLAFLLGLIPGVGAIYNGQYVKGLIHVVILGLLIGILDSGEAVGLEPLFGMMTAAWVFYMAFEAYHTAKKRQLGQPVDEFSSIVPLKGRRSSFPAAPAFLIAVGLLFLLNNLDIIRFGQLLRYWPVALIALGAYMLYMRLAPEDRTIGTHAHREATNERR